MKLKLKDGSEIDVKEGMSILDIAKQISESLARMATCGSLLEEGENFLGSSDKKEHKREVKDLRYKIKKSDEGKVLIIHTFKEDDLDGKKAYWHTTAHIMAQAIKRLYKDRTVHLTIGPAIEEGFYYDFDIDKPISESDFEKIEAEMKKIIKEDLPLTRFEASKEEALKIAKEADEPYKQELIEEIPEGDEISFYTQGEFTDLCSGPHVLSTGKIKFVKLLSTSGAYWRGDEHNKMLQRIYGISFPKKAELEEFLKLKEEAKERDHRKIGKEMDLFMTHELVGSGLPMYLPHGATIRRVLERYIQDQELARGYEHVYTPSMGNVELYKTSGHWDHYKDDMFPPMQLDNEAYVLRPMNCPHHMLIYKNKLRSYRDLPIRIAELAHDFRYEASGSVCGLERVREMCQNDSHIFIRHDQIKQEISEVVKFILDVYKDFGFQNYKFRLSLRDKKDKKKYFDDDKMWDSAEEQLRETLKELGFEFYEAEGEAAFYGPKLDVQIKSALGHDVTLSTCQLDFLLPERFKLTYIGEDGKEHRPVVIHRAIIGTSDRFIAFLIEETKGAFPTWIAPVQAKILPISDSENQLEYSKKIAEEYRKAGIRIEVDSRNEKIGYKIREGRLQRIPYLLVVGDKEVESNSLAVRSRKDGDIGAINKDEFLQTLKKEIDEKSRNN